MLATVLFFVVSSVVVFTYWTKIGEIVLTLSISKHVGLAVYSCILFAIVNTVVVVLLVWYLNYLYEVHRFPKIWLMIASAMAVGLLIASYFPFTGEGLWNSVVHRAASWTMFSMAAVFCLVTLWSLRTRWPIVIGLVLLAFGALCLLWVTCFADFFWDYVLIIESSFILLVFLFILAIPLGKRDQFPTTV